MIQKGELPVNCPVACALAGEPADRKTATTKQSKAAVAFISSLPDWLDSANLKLA
jgi:hypothetical protein